VLHGVSEYICVAGAGKDFKGADLQYQSSQLSPGETETFREITVMNLAKVVKVD